ncbi:MAG: hypothetical protein ACRBC3_17520 [Burkholderiaceae bacterium]
MSNQSIDTAAPRSPLNRDSDALAEATPWFLNETLTEEDRVWFDEAIGQDQGLANALSFDRQIAETLQERAAEVPADIGWDKLLKRVRADEARPQLVEQTGLGSKISGFFSGLFSPAVGMGMAAILVAQAVAIGVLVDDKPDTVEYRTVGTLQPTPVIRAIIDENTTEKTIRETLSANGANIAAGPSQLGEYLLTVDRDSDIAVVAAALKQSGVLVSFSLDTHVIGQ